VDVPTQARTSTDTSAPSGAIRWLACAAGIKQ